MHIHNLSKPDAHINSILLLLLLLLLLIFHIFIIFFHSFLIFTILGSIKQKAFFLFLNSLSFFLSFFHILTIYKDESKVLQYFGNVTHNSAASDAFVEVMKVMNHFGLWGAKLAWYSLCATCWIWLYGLEHSFRPTWPWWGHEDDELNCLSCSLKNIMYFYKEFFQFEL